MIDYHIQNENRNKKGRMYVDATPDGSYALRILQAYRVDCDTRISESTTKEAKNPLFIELNKLQKLRAEELDCAIAKLKESEGV